MTAAAAAAATASSGESSRPSWILLNTDARVGEHHNETTADCYGRNGAKIRASLAREHPPVPSNLYVHCSGASFGEPPCLLYMMDDLILFHVFTGRPYGIATPWNTDFFMYRADPNRPSLTLLPHPEGRVDKGHQFGIFPRGEDGYTIAVLVPLRNSDRGMFKLSLYDSETRIWSWKKLPVESPQKEFAVDDIPDNLLHHTSTVLTIGDTIGWVDLSRGIVFCDMLSEKHMLRGIPLPLPLKCTEPDAADSSKTLRRSERGIAFVDGCLRLAEVSCEVVADGPPCVYDEETGWPRCRTENWTITTWTNKEMSNSYDGWHVDCTLQASDFLLADYSESERPPVDLRNLFVCDPTISVDGHDGHVVYLTARVKFMHPKSWVLAVDTRDRKVQSVLRSGPEPQEMRFIDAYYCDCRISK